MSNLLRHAPRTPIATGSDQRERRAPSQSPLPAAAGLGGTSGLVSQGMHRRFGISGLELCDDPHVDAGLLQDAELAPPPCAADGDLTSAYSWTPPPLAVGS